jgi:hypothetical protein
MLLSAAIRVAPDEGGVVRVDLPAAQLALEPISSPANRRTLEAQLSQRLGRKVTLRYAAGDAPAGGTTRITTESAKRDRLERMMEGEPVLAAAVQAWDLELAD